VQPLPAAALAAISACAHAFSPASISGMLALSQGMDMVSIMSSTALHVRFPSSSCTPPKLVAVVPVRLLQAPGRIRNDMHRDMRWRHEAWQ
jgi:hypothetical protein